MSYKLHSCSTRSTGITTVLKSRLYDVALGQHFGIRDGNLLILPSITLPIPWCNMTPKILITI